MWSVSKCSRYACLRDFTRLLTILFSSVQSSVQGDRRGGVEVASHAGDRGSIPGRDRPKP